VDGFQVARAATREDTKVKASRSLKIMSSEAY
jgi:hypothetical protein